MAERVGLHTRPRPAEVAPLMEAAHDYSGASSDRLPVVFDFG